MPRYHTLEGFLEETGYLDLRSDPPVPRLYGPARLIRRHEGGPPILYRVEGARVDAASNLVDTRSKLYRALGAGGDEEAYLKILGARPGRPPVDGFPGGYRELESLLDLPAAKFYERDGGLYINSGVFVSCLGGSCNASIHRIMVTGPREARVRLVPRHLYSMYREAAASGRDLPVTILVGVHPAYMVASALSPPRGVYELSIAAGILGDRLVESPLHRHPVPLASVIIEGRLTRETAPEGPYADILLLYDRVRMQPVLRVDKILWSGGPAHVILNGGMEHIMLMGFPREASIWDSVRRVVPRVYKVRLTPGGGGWLHAVISIEKAHPGDGKNAIMAAFAGHTSLKHVVVVDGDIDVDDPRMVEWAIATRFQADRDLVVVKEARGSTLDPSGREGMGAKMGIDATVKGDREMFERARIPGEGE